MKAKFNNIEIEGICSVLPANTVKFDDEIFNYNFTSAQSKKLKIAFGLNERRVAEPGVCTSDLAVYAFEKIFKQRPNIKAEIDAIIFVSQTPDYQIPPTSNLIQARLGLSENIYCIDINQGCAGFIIGYFHACQLLTTTEINKVAIISGDVLSAKVSPKDRNSRPLVGDAVAVTIIRRSLTQGMNVFNIQMNGEDGMALAIPAGGARLPYGSDSSKLHMDSAGNERAPMHLVMKGDLVFNFVQNKIPDLIHSVMEDAKLSMDAIRYFFFHQPNEFMLKKLASAIDVPFDRMPSDIVGKYGNSSGATIPVVITDRYINAPFQDGDICCLAGFGVGLTWAAVVTKMTKFNFCFFEEY